jgi:hypothetical protein
MSKKQPREVKSGAVEEAINREIDSMLNRLRGRGVCPCCAAQGMMYRGAFLHADVTGSADTIELCMDVADSIQPDDASDTQH